MNTGWVVQYALDRGHWFFAGIRENRAAARRLARYYRQNGYKWVRHSRWTRTDY